MVETDTFTDRLSKVETWNQGLLFGSADLGLIGSLKRDSRRDAMNFNDACPYITLAEADDISNWPIPDSARDCRTVQSGVFTNGLFAAFSLYTSVATRVRGRLLEVATDANATRIRQYLQGSDLSSINLMERSWLTHALRVDADMYYHHQIQHLRRTLDARSAMLAVFLTALVLCYFTIYGPLVQQMDAQLKRVRGLLVMIPVEIAQAIPSLRHLLLGAPPS